MARNVNRSGLSRDIPADVARTVRQECGFGCIFCGCAIYEYHHIVPFAGARSHDPRAIALVCGQHHHYATRWSVDKFKEARLNPYCRKHGFSWGAFDYVSRPTVLVGNNTFVDVPIIIEAFQLPLLRVDPPECEGGPFRLSGVFLDDSEREIFRIVQNEWRGLTSAWEIEVSGQFITVRSAPRKIALKLESKPRELLTVKRINLRYRGGTIVGGPHEITCTNGACFGTSGGRISGCEAGIIIREGGVSVAGRSRCPRPMQVEPIQRGPAAHACGWAAC